jgi:hypothetical protein
MLRADRMTFDPELFTRIESKEDAWREKAEYDYMLDASHEYIAEEIRQAFEGKSVESTRAYLGMYGDAVTARVRGAIEEATALLGAGHPGPATLLAHTAVELTIGYLVIRPIVQGAFLSDEWAAVLTDQIVRDAPGERGRLLPLIAQAWDLKLDDLRLADGSAAWGVFTGSVTPARNAFVHRAEPVSAELAARAISCAEVLLEGLVGPLAESAGMDWPAHPWKDAYQLGGWALPSFEPRDPFAKQQAGRGALP